MLDNIPTTRYMGSKYKLLEHIWDAVKHLEFNSVIDAFSGSGSVAYMFKTKDKQVIANDQMVFCYHFANAIIANNTTVLEEADVSFLLEDNDQAPTFIQDTFEGLYFEQSDNKFLDNVRTNVDLLDNSIKKSIALSALARACLKKRPRGIFAYTGFRYDDGRRDIQLSLKDHFVESVAVFNDAVFDNRKTNAADNLDIFKLQQDADLIYIDPPYYSPRSDSDYVRRYHFVEGLVRYWEGVKIQKKTKTKKFKRYPTEFSGKDATYKAFPKLFEKYHDKILVISYSSNSLPSKDEMVEMLEGVGKKVDVFGVDYKYSFGTQHSGDDIANDVKEFIFIAQ